MTVRTLRSTWYCCIAFVVIVGGLSGCGSNGSGRYNVSGTVKYAGQPVPKGEIVFEPDPARSNKGPQGRARIDQGKFQTVAGHGVVAGPVIARVLAYDGKTQAEAPFGAPLARPFSLPLDLPAADSTHDFVVPPAHSK